MGYTLTGIVGILGSGFLLGLSAGPYCLGYCGPVIIPYMLGEGGNARQNVRTIIKFCSGRLVSYVTIGFVSAYIGGIIGSSCMETFRSVALIITSILLIMYSTGKTAFCRSILRERRVKNLPVVFGLLTGLNVCPAFLVGLSYTLGVGNPLDGMIFFFSFFIATLMYLIPLLFLTFLDCSVLRKIGRIASFLAGCWFLFLGVRWLWLC